MEAMLLPTNLVLVRLPEQGSSLIDRLVNCIVRFGVVAHEKCDATIAPFAHKETACPNENERAVIFKYNNAWMRIEVRRNPAPTFREDRKVFSYQIKISADDKRLVAMHLTRFLEPIQLG